MKNKHVLITVEDFMERYSISQENFRYLVKKRELVPFTWGIQTFLHLEDIRLSVGNVHMHAEMKAGLHQPRKTNSNNIHQ